MTHYFAPAIAVLLLIILTLFISGHTCCQENSKRITIFYTNDLEGTLEPCG